MLTDIYIILFMMVVICNDCEGVCEEAPKDCSRDKINFFYYPRQNEQPYELVLNETDTIRQAPFNPEANFKFIIHGYAGSKDNPLMNRIREEYFQQKSWNLIFVNYPTLAKDGCYIESTFPSVPIVGKCSAELIDLILKEKDGTKIEQFHVIGFSMGAQISAEISTNLKPKILSRITGLDPAWPLFYPIITSRDERLNRRHANFVDVIHTNSGGLGVLYSHAHYDIYANNGSFQPGCQIDNISCSHSRALEYYIESINSKTPFIANRCSFWRWTTLRSSDDNLNLTIVAGEHAIPPTNSDDEGIYHFKTNSKAPFAIGQPAQ